MPDELKPCPFCGGLAKIYDVLSFDGQKLEVASASCESEHCRTITTHGTMCVKEAIHIWNTRPLEDALRARLEAAEELIAAMDEQERLNKEPLTNYSGFLTAFRREFHKGDVTAARKKWEAVNGSHE